MHCSNRLTRLSGLFLTVYILLCRPAGAQSNVCYVDSDPQYTSVNGNSWDAPTKSIQHAIDIVADAGGGEVWVKAGVYKPEGGTRTATFTLRPNVQLLGGFKGNETDRSQRNPKANRTILSGDIGNSFDSDNCYHIITGISGCQIDGFIVSKGNANGIGKDGAGAGVLLPKGSKDFRISNCTFERNSASWQGAGIYAEDSSLSLSNCTFYSNAATSGAGLAANGHTDLKVYDSFFSANYSSVSGGAVELESGVEAMFVRTRFLNNSSNGNGGALAAKQTDANSMKLQLSNCIFTGNLANQAAGAVFISGAFSPIITQCVFEQNIGKNGAGAIDITTGSKSIIANCTFTQNRGIEGEEDTAHDETSIIVDSQEALASLTSPPETETTTPAPEPAPKRSVPDVDVYHLQGAKSNLRGIVESAPFTVLVLGDLTDPEFIKNYRTVEALGRDYKAGKVQLFYIYRYLLHPENNGYLQPFNLIERARQAQRATQLLTTTIPWLYDTLDNETALALSPNHDKDIFIFSGDGLELYSAPMSDASSLRPALSNIAGPAESNTSPESLPPPKIKPVNMSDPVLLDRVRFDPSTDRMVPLKIIPDNSPYPYYAKIRVEGNDELLSSGEGKLYIGLHLDPLYQMAWDNVEDPPRYALRPSKGVIAPSMNAAPSIMAESSDTEPREFLLNARHVDTTQTIVLQVEYTVVSKATGKSTKVSQLYRILLERDPCGGEAYRRQIAYDDPRPFQSNKSDTSIHPSLRKYDTNGDGKLTRDEVSGNLYSKFPEIDKNRDGYLSTEEYADYLRNR